MNDYWLNIIKSILLLLFLLWLWTIQAGGTVNLGSKCTIFLNTESYVTGLDKTKVRFSEETTTKEQKLYR